MIDYYQYIQSPEWFIRTESVRQRNNRLCEVCNMRYGRCVHHRTYDRLGEELPEDMIHCCKLCHRMIHRKGKYFIHSIRVPFLVALQQEADKLFDLDLEQGE